MTDYVDIRGTVDVTYLYFSKASNMVYLELEKCFKRTLSDESQISRKVTPALEKVMGTQMGENVLAITGCGGERVAA